ncbi:hypothetical protein EMPS_04344 [Entomortierella parvispora]|uniref:Uncharacterized protein n=1 Tax=Entomortierella parvispora TaxID=205924 RepID=A0A9P3H927_9FUNG|nr:hypothetical protein EMPS_04344 [Entomortierella parvispora]
MVSYSAFRFWRIAVAFIATLNFIAMVTYYGRWASYSSGLGLIAPTLSWRDWIVTVISVVFFISYCYSVSGKRSLLHRFIRAFFLFALSVLLLYVNLVAIRFALQLQQNIPDDIAFSCHGFLVCILSWVFAFMSIILGFIVIFDVGITLKLGPCEPKSATSGLQQNQASVVVVQPQQGYYQPQQYYTPQPDQMQQQQYQQQYYQQPIQQNSPPQQESSFKYEQVPQSPMYNPPYGYQTPPIRYN